MFNDISKSELYSIDGGIVITTSTIIICAVSSFILGGVCGAGIYVGYKNAAK